MKQTKDASIVLKFSVIWGFIGILIMALILSAFKSRIFATNSQKTDNVDEQPETIVAFEQNKKSVDVIQVMLENTDSNKKMVNEQRDVNFSIEYVDNPNLPKSEEKVKQEGVIGKVQVTALQEYQNNEMVDEDIIETITLIEVVPKIIEVGTSEFLSKYKVHIDDTMYLLEATDLKEDKKDDSNTICQIPRYLNVTIKEAGEEWIKVKYGDKEGYLKTNNITSEAVMPLIKEKNRIANLQNKVNIEMDLSVPSGLTLSDFKTILSNNSNDANKIFQNSAEAFYKAEQKYKINGVFVAAVGIHESAWGTSRIAVDKNNLFGFTAYDSDPYNSATTFDNYENAINKVAETLSVKYLHPSGSPISDDLIATGVYYNGTTVSAVNVKYASDKNWGTKVFSYIQYLYNRL